MALQSNSLIQVQENTSQNYILLQNCLIENRNYKKKSFSVDQENPGPGAYSIPVDITNGPKYSMSTKAGLKESKEKLISPGPAHYKPIFNRSQSCFYTFGLKTKIKEGDKTPGPGNYDIRKDKDLIILSYLLGKEKRDDEIIKRKKKIPGPRKI